MQLSIIIPTLNEAENICLGLPRLQKLRQAGHELILVDGGSRDQTIKLARPQVDKLLVVEPGRANQMNAGAQVAQGEWLLFLHADTVLPRDAETLLAAALPGSFKCWGRFNVRLSSEQRLFRIIEWMMNWRSRVTGIATGDQALFVSRAVFESIGGYSNIPLMEDIELSRRLKKISAPICIAEPLVTSSRRWEDQGVYRTILLMWWLRLAYFFGADPKWLYAQYCQKREYQLQSNSEEAVG